MLQLLMKPQVQLKTFNQKNFISKGFTKLYQNLRNDTNIIQTIKYICINKDTNHQIVDKLDPTI